MDPSPQNPNNKFVEGGIKSQPGSKAMILDSSVRRKELYVCISTKDILGYDLLLSLVSTHFFLFSLFSFLIFFFSPLPFFLPSYYILWLFHFFLHLCVDQALKALFLHLPCLFLNLSFLAVRLRVHCSGITSTLMRPEGQLGGI